LGSTAFPHFAELLETWVAMSGFGRSRQESSSTRLAYAAGFVGFSRQGPKQGEIEKVPPPQESDVILRGFATPR
jgi:hypothetical protein